MFKWIENKYQSDTIVKTATILKKGRCYHIVSFLPNPLPLFSPPSFFLPLFLFFHFQMNTSSYNMTKNVLKKTNNSDNKIAECVFIVPHVKMADLKTLTH